MKEQAIRDFSSQVRDKPNWTQKIQDPKLRKKWFSESEEYWQTKLAHRDRAPVPLWDKDEIEYVLDELNTSYKPWVEKAGPHGIVPGIDCVWRADGLIDANLRNKLLFGA